MLDSFFLSKFGPKNQNCQFKLKFGTKANSNLQNSVVLCTFSVFDLQFVSKKTFGFLMLPD